MDSDGLIIVFNKIILSRLQDKQKKMKSLFEAKIDRKNNLTR